MKNQKMLTSLVLALVVAGCATTSQQANETPPQHAKRAQQANETPPQHAKRVQVSIYDSSPRPKTAHLDIYDTKPPQKPYKVIALFTCEGAPKEEAPMMTAIFYRARLIGADAVMRADTAYTQEGGGIVWGSHGGFGGGSSTRCVFRAKAIVYEDK